MKASKAKEIIDRLDAFAKLERRATDEAGWIALAYSCSRLKAARMIAQARETISKPVAEAGS